MRRFGAVVAALVFVVSVRADVRPVSDAERAAVAMAAQYLAVGAAALVDDLAAASPLRKIAPAAIPLEIEARLGPHGGAQWRLVTVVDALKDKAAAFEISYPSGLDESVFFEMVREGEAWKIADLRITAMPSARQPLFPEAPRQSEAATAERADETPVAIFAAAAAIVLAAIALLLMRTRALLGRVAYLVAFAAVGFAVWQSLAVVVTKPAAAKQEAAITDVRLAPLLDLRRALAAGGHDSAAAFASAPRAGFQGDTARLWKAKWDLTQMNLAEVKRTLDGFSSPSNVPLVEILRARLALVENRPEGAVVAYQNAINAGPGRDTLWLEMSMAFFSGGFEDLARKSLQRLYDIGSREPSLYYARAALSKTPDEMDSELKKAWNLRPYTRSWLVESGLLWNVVRRANPFVNLADPHEPRFASPQTGTRAIDVPAGVTCRVSGEFLHIAAGDAHLEVAGGAPLASHAAAFVGADEWETLEETRALADVPSLLQSPPTAGSYMQPSLRSRITSAVEALSERNRHEDVLALTGEVSPKSEFVPPSLFFLRAGALQRMKRADEAKRLLLELARSPVLARRRDAGSLERLAEKLASYDEHEAAIRIIERARNIRQSPYHEVRIAQLMMDQRLAKQYQTHSTPNFQIQFPQEMPPALAQRLGVVLEGELKRLQPVIPVATFQPVVVNVVWWRDFKSIYTGSEDVLGFYNGKITLPLAGVADMNPFVVAIVTHELAHAMIAQATNDQAPRWFHEGLAQRVSMVEYHPNAFNMYDDDKLFAISVLEPMFLSSRDPDMVGAAYVMSQTLIRFIEDRYGSGAIRKMLEAYRGGATSEQALTALAQKNLGTLNAEFRTWGKAENRVFENQIAVRYDEAEEEVKIVPVATGRRPDNAGQRGRIGGGTFYPQPGAKP